MRHWRTTVRLSALLAAATFVLMQLQDSYFAYLAQLVAVYGILALSLNLLFGYAGQISLGHSVFFAVGAYGSAILQTRFSFGAVSAAGSSVAVGVVVAYAIGIPILRLRGHFLALATMALGLITHHILIAERSWTRGHDGILINNRATIGDFASDNLAYIAVGLLLLTFITIEAVSKATPGRALRLLQSNEMVASSLGINVGWYKAHVFAVSAGFASLAGALYLHTMRIITPDTFGLHTSIAILLIVVIGGAGSHYGALMGAALFVLLPELLRGFADYSALIYGILVLLVLLFAPKGIAGLFSSVQRARLSSYQRISVQTPTQVVRAVGDSDA